MLKTRVITALLLLAVVVAALVLLDARGWALVVLVFMAGAIWEWGRFAKLTGVQLWGFVAITLIAALGLFVAGLGGRAALGSFVWLYGLATAFWLIAVPLWLSGKLAVPTGWLLAFAGWFVILPAWAAISEGRLFGPLALFLLMGLTWIADIAAYFSGRAFGKRKLAPSISPGKTWEGVYGAVLGVLLLAVISSLVSQLTPNFYAMLTKKQGWPLGCAVIIVLVAVSVMGDLFESLLKRRIGIKDSSNLLPGHGGVMDRVDALVATMPVAMFAGHMLQLW